VTIYGSRIVINVAQTPRTSMKQAGALAVSDGMCARDGRGGDSEQQSGRRWKPSEMGKRVSLYGAWESQPKARCANLCPLEHLLVSLGLCTGSPDPNTRNTRIIHLFSSDSAQESFIFFHQIRHKSHSSFIRFGTQRHTAQPSPDLASRG
jgi:hypothetical protein